MEINLKSVFKYPSLFISTGFGIGLAPVAPGTFGSFLGAIIFLFISHLYLSDFFMMVILLTVFVISQISISLTLENLRSIQVVNMKKNQGHARCNATGLKYIFEKEEFDYVIPMDGDGEDRPEEIIQLVDNLTYYPDKPIKKRK